MRSRVKKHPQEIGPLEGCRLEVDCLGRVAGEVQVNGFRTFERDDENDTRLFEELEKHVLEHYPNPQRIGCLDQAILEFFVDAPENLDLADPKYLHIFKCAECSRELRELRRVREDRLQQECAGSSTSSNSGREVSLRWIQQLRAAVAQVRAAAIGRVAGLSDHFRRPPGEARTEGAVQRTIDLSSGPLAKAGEGSREHYAALPRKLIELHMVLPLGSQDGIYRITIAKDQHMRRIQSDVSAYALTHGSSTELNVLLDLRHADPGEHFLVCRCEGEGVTHSYRFLLI
jgi:hypothetical protein